MFIYQKYFDHSEISMMARLINICAYIYSKDKNYLVAYSNLKDINALFLLSKWYVYHQSIYIDLLSQKILDPFPYCIEMHIVIDRYK